MSTKIVNPNTGRHIKVGGQTHWKLIKEGILEHNTLNLNKENIRKNTRAKYTKPVVIYNKKTTQFTNLIVIVDDINKIIGRFVDDSSVNQYDIIRHFKKEYPVLKIITDSDTKLIFPGKEPFICDCLKDYIDDLFKSFDDTSLNQ